MNLEKGGINDTYITIENIKLKIVEYILIVLILTDIIAATPCFPPYNHISKKEKQMRAIITVVGKDQVGIIAKISTILADSKINILDINQTILQNYFTMMMLVDLSGINTEIAELRNTLDNLGKELTLSITLQQEEIFHAMHRID